MNVTSSPSGSAAVTCDHAERLAPGSISATTRTVWSIELRRDTPASRIAIERLAETHDYRVLVDEVEVGRSDRLDLVLTYVQRFKAPTSIEEMDTEGDHICRATEMLRGALTMIECGDHEGVVNRLRLAYDLIGRAHIAAQKRWQASRSQG